MPRPKKCRRVCCLPTAASFIPLGKHEDFPPVVITVDEFETIRLIDHEGFSQEECSAYMNVARTTVQQIYNTARHKLSAALVEGRPFRIEGGDYQLCEGNEPYCACGGCPRHRQLCLQKAQKEEKKMLIAVPVDETKEVPCVSFARAPYFLFYNTETKTSEIETNPAADAEGGAGIKAAQFLVDHNVNSVLTVRCGENAAEILQAADITIYKTLSGSVSENLNAFAEEKLALMTSFHAGYHGFH